MRALLLSLTVGPLLWAADPLADGFTNPPREYRPETWFHLIGGNVAKEGLTADLEAVAGAGLQGIQLFHGQFGGAWPQVEPQVPCLSPAWDGMIQHVANECRRLGLRFTMQNCPGWAMSGGPWITPDKAMRHLVWSRVDVAGGGAVDLALKKPMPSNEEWRDYRDVAVLAFPTPAGDNDKDLQPLTVRSNREDLPWRALLEGKGKTRVRLEAGGEAPWLEVSFAEPVTMRTIELPSVERSTLRHNFDPGAVLQVQALTAQGLTAVARRVMPRSTWQDDRPLILALPDATAATWRITFEITHPLELDRLRLSSAARIHDAQGQAGFALRSLDRSLLPVQDRATWVSSSAIVDLGPYLDATGQLNWVAPAGAWTVVRFGHVNTGAKNGPAPKEGTGFECDKLATAGAEAHFAGYIGRLSAANGPAGGGRLNGMLTDSWECRTQTWTPAMEAAFRSRRGYDLRRWLPALAGWVVDDHLTSERFLRDWRATIDDLLVTQFFGRMATLAHERGLVTSFETAAGDVMVGDILRYFGQADIPMCEFWQPNDPHHGGLETKPITPCASAAHIYGRNRIAAEAFTNIGLKWNEHPGMLKSYADKHLALGLNHLVFHTYTHNPRLDVVPGTSFGAGIGTPFLRNQTWWRHMPAFVTYLARCQYLLQQGRPVADVLWFLGDELDHKPRSDASFPAGHRFDYVNPDVLMNRLEVGADGTLVTPEGLSWRVLWLRDCPRLTPATLERLRTLITAGATVVGDPPRACATLEGGADADRRFAALVRELWGEVPAAGGERRIGAGRLRWGGTLDSHLAALAIAPDCAGADDLSWCHRRSGAGDVYFIANPAGTAWRGAVTLRTTGGAELWDPLTGDRQPAGLASGDATATRVHLDLPPAGSVFVVVRPGPPTEGWTGLERAGTSIATTTGPEAVGTRATSAVVRAVYGSPDDAQRQQDVTVVVRQLVEDGRTVVAGSALAGRDPAPGQVKELVVTLRTGDGEHTRRVPEGQPLEMRPSAPAPLPPATLVDGGRSLLAWEAGTFVLRRGTTTPVTLRVEGPRTIPVAGPWTLEIPGGWDAPARLEMPELKPWSDSALPAVRAFSGSATYATSVTLPAFGTDQRVLLDLGRVAVIAAVTVNGQPVATRWCGPFHWDITPFLLTGANRIAVTVTSTWLNRLIHDAGLPAAERRTWTISGPGAKTPREDAGLVGPVVLHLGKVVALP